MPKPVSRSIRCCGVGGYVATLFVAGLRPDALVRGLNAPGALACSSAINWKHGIAKVRCSAEGVKNFPRWLSAACFAADQTHLLGTINGLPIQGLQTRVKARNKAEPTHC